MKALRLCHKTKTWEIWLTVWFNFPVESKRLILSPENIRKLESLPNHQRSKILKECYLTPSVKLKCYLYDFIVLHGCLWQQGLSVITHNVSSGLCSLAIRITELSMLGLNIRMTTGTFSCYTCEKPWTRSHLLITFLLDIIANSRDRNHWFLNSLRLRLYLIRTICSFMCLQPHVCMLWGWT